MPSLASSGICSGAPARSAPNELRLARSVGQKALEPERAVLRGEASGEQSCLQTQGAVEIQLDTLVDGRLCHPQGVWALRVAARIFHSGLIDVFVGQDL